MMYGGKESEIPNLPRDACRLVRTRVVTDIATGVNPRPPVPAHHRLSGARAQSPEPRLLAACRRVWVDLAWVQRGDTRDSYTTHLRRVV